MSPKTGDRICNAIPFAITALGWIAVATAIGMIAHGPAMSTICYWSAGLSVALMLLKWPIEWLLPGEQGNESEEAPE